MNRIAAAEGQTKYSGEHLVLTVDGLPLDKLVSDFEAGARDLVPTLLGWMDDEAEREIAWQRFLPAEGSTSVAPLLICPDDLDFWCSTLVAEVVAESELVYWKRLGWNLAKPMPVENVGASVHWLSGIGPFTFTRSEYERCREDFRGIFCSTDSAAKLG